MKITYTNAIRKDVKKLKDDKTVAKIELLLQTIKEVGSVNEIPNVQKMKGHPGAYRIRLGNYRLGFYLKDDIVVLGRFLKRNDIYKLFP